jgi:PAS domain S-box-containing protein
LEKPAKKFTDLSFLEGGGKMRETIRAHDWKASDFGDPSLWPDSLCSHLGMVLNSKLPALLFMGARHICFFNDASAKLFSVNGPDETLLGREGKEVLPELWALIGQHVSAIVAGAEGLLVDDQPLTFFSNGKLKEGRWNFSCSPVIDELNHRNGVLVFCIESGNKEKDENTLPFSNETARLAIEAGQLGVVQVDLRTEEIVISERVAEIFGLRSPTDRASLLAQIHSEDLIHREEAYRKALLTGRLEYEARVLRSDKSVRWISVTGSILFENDNIPARMICVVQDITEQKMFSQELSSLVKDRTQKLEEAHNFLLSSNSYFQSIINIFTTALQVLEPVIENGKVVDFIYKLTNQAYASYAQRKPEELVGRRVSEFFPGYFDTDSFRNISEVAMSGIPKIWENHYSADGFDIYNEMGAVNMEGNIVVHLTDFTKLKLLQIELVRNIAELKRSNENLGQFAHAASHDLKEPIRKIQVFAGQLNDQLSLTLTPAQKRAFERIQSSSLRMGQLVDDLLMYSHVSETPQEMEEVRLTEILEQVLEDLELHIQEKRAIIEATLLPTVLGYKRQLQQLLQNLVSNAIKYSKEAIPPIVNISASIIKEQGQKYNVITIKDNGIGFDDIYSDQIFQMFTRLHNRNEFSGTGVGLSIVKKVVENHKGRVSAKGVPGDGSIFKIFLPA